MLKYSLSYYDEDDVAEYLTTLSEADNDELLIDSINSILSDSDYEDDEVVKFINACEWNIGLLSDGESS